MKFQVTGVNRETGNTVEPIIIEAGSNEAALQVASERGVFVEKITHYGTSLRRNRLRLRWK